MASRPAPESCFWTQTTVQIHPHNSDTAATAAAVERLRQGTVVGFVRCASPTAPIFACAIEVMIGCKQQRHLPQGKTFPRVSQAT